MSIESSTPFTPEKLNLWDRLFNRYRRVFHQRGFEAWCYRISGAQIGNGFPCEWIEYRIIDRLTGSERIEREYLN